MHDKNGKPINVGDFVRHTTYVNGAQKTVVAQVVTTNPGAESCNVYLGVPYIGPKIREEYANAKDVEVV